MVLAITGCPRLLLPVVRRTEDLIKRYNDILNPGQSLEKFRRSMYEVDLASVASHSILYNRP
jgi:hypothetical protein